MMTEGGGGGGGGVGAKGGNETFKVQQGIIFTVRKLSQWAIEIKPMGNTQISFISLKAG